MMGVKELREAFNAEAAGALACTRATLGYVQEQGTEWQILSFSGTDANGAPFETIARIAAKDDVNQAARNAARALIDKPPQQ